MDILIAFWLTLVQVAPYLLLGFLLAGIMSVLIPVAWVRRQLGGNGVRPCLKAALLGIPLPICSCGVIPLAVSLRQHGASRAATLSFLVATPQTSIDSILLCLVLIGPFFAIASPAAALLGAGAAAGLYTLLRRRGDDQPPPPPSAEAIAADNAQRPRGWLATLGRALSHGFLIIPGSIGREVVIGLLIAAAISVYLPGDLISTYLGNSLWAKLAMVAAAVPVYVCSTSSVPVVAALIAKGVSPGTALVFYLAGSVTNAATLVAVGKSLGGRALTAYVVAVSATAIALGTLLDALVPAITVDLAGVHDHHLGTDPIGQLAAAVVLVVLLRATVLRLWRLFSQRQAPTTACCGSTPPPATDECCHQTEPAPAAKSESEQRPCCCQHGADPDQPG